MRVSNELSRQVIHIKKTIKRFGYNDKKYKVLIERKNSIKSLITALKESVNRVTGLIKGAINEEIIGTIVEFPQKVMKAVETV